jgi:1,4-dihydroxy-2-naphthoyl-CoA synthase
MRVLSGLVHDADVEGWELTREAEAVIYAADDTREGVAAFFERREPRWTGR